MALLLWLELDSHASEVAAAAAVLASRMKCILHLVSVCPGSRSPQNVEAREHATLVRARLARKAEQVRRIAANVQIHVEDGPAERSLSELSRRIHATMILVRRGGRAQRLDLLSQHTHVPVLVLSETVPFLAWNERPLRLFAALDTAPHREPIVTAIRRFEAAGECRVTVAQLIEDTARQPSQPEQSVQEELREDVAQLGAGPTWRVFVDTHRGPRAEHLLALAAFAQADLIVMGSRTMSRLSRLWEGSVSRRVLHDAPCSVLCIPLGDVWPAHDHSTF